ncbi:MAG: hypothetical protein US53_C0015G0008 [Candidatus Woesebacteria bacterium GW2011_GWA1_37_7]|uniref:NYN domain-containing protein n=1 Tax=Candidatus Woesebacteria bacterium GW2011_GWA1_37_7 TaxID=1618545 RepID=A0A0G0KAF3_9BACT|nr:MAG: hypothetical protein US53_C0015G0008 [Candidatus Woesebacteria bacterium GW2011_GWA1_37_7]
MEKKKSEKLHLKLKGKTAVYIDWANVHGWEEKLKWKVDIKKLYKYLDFHKGINDVGFYFGTDKNKKSREFLEKAREVGYRVVTKPVKYLSMGIINGKMILKRKCDFDMEICMDVHKFLEGDVEGFIFFTGDGDFAPLYKLLISRGKQIIVVSTRWSLGKEVAQIRKGLYILNVSVLLKFIAKKMPSAKG